MSAVDQAAEARRLAAADVSQREIARRLGVSRYKVGQLLAEPVDQPSATVADRAALADRPVDQPVSQAPDQRSTRGRCLVIDLDRYPGLAEDLALLQGTRAAPVDVVNFAVDRLASAYRGALARGRLVVGQPFDVTAMSIRPAGGPQ
ncbi:hypothetical protein AB0R01_14705 [Streptomyces rochei]|uniref:hypothetical protein n=1 Tax=Streptomyces TaxID=1883 RepID=UPI001CBE33EC|nr:hypothetical protein [Streptomyces sp. A144]UAX56782.1 hypothetical protein K5X85_29075 [Streptomyces sp. A144]